MKKAFELFLFDNLNNKSPDSYLSYVRSAFKKFSGETTNIYDFLNEYTQDSRIHYCEYLISLINNEIKNQNSKHNPKTLKNYKSGLSMLANFFESGMYSYSGAKVFSKDIAYIDDDLIENFTFRLETQDRYYSTCCFPCRLFAKIFLRNRKYKDMLVKTLKNTKFIINAQQDYVTLSEVGLLVISPNSVEVWHGNNGAIDDVYTEVFIKGVSNGFAKSTAQTLRQLSLDHDKPLIDIVTRKIGGLPELKKISDALLSYKAQTGLTGSKLATSFYANVYDNLGVNSALLLDDIMAIYDEVNLTIMDKKYNSSRNSNP